MARSGDELEKAYLDWTPRSRALFEQACRWLPGGDTRATAHYPPYPAFMERGSGCRLVDVDGHEYTDFMNNFTSLIHGHAHPATVRAVQAQIELGSAYAAPTGTQVELAQLLCERVPSLDELRFTSSGSEATNMCIRAARAWTGKPKVMKVEGGYHGSHELGEMSLIPLPGKSGPPDRPETLPPDHAPVQRRGRGARAAGGARRRGRRPDRRADDGRHGHDRAGARLPRGVATLHRRV
jgi:glutamate-1-semialdehyde 2,1-aminomutase